MRAAAQLGLSRVRQPAKLHQLQQQQTGAAGGELFGLALRAGERGQLQGVRGWVCGEEQFSLRAE